MTTEIQDVQESQAFEEAFTLNEKLLKHATLMEESGSDTAANRSTLAVLRLHLKRMIVSTVRRYMRPGDKEELERLFESVVKTIGEARLEILSRTNVDRIRAKQLLDDFDALEGLTNDYRTELLTCNPYDWSTRRTAPQLL
jgi:hypothetical protein